jgi:hypothetical protein
MITTWTTRSSKSRTKVTPTFVQPLRAATEEVPDVPLGQAIRRVLPPADLLEHVADPTPDLGIRGLKVRHLLVG